jgi:hypothetical protein
VTLIKERLGIEAVKVPGATGQFDVVVDGKTIATRGGNWLTRSFGAGYPELDTLVAQIKKHSTDDAAR